MINPKTEISTVLEFNGARATVIEKQNGFLTVRWEEKAGGDLSQYTAYRIECDRRWRVVEA